MGVDWYSCNYCGKSFPDCGHYVGCECGERWCSDKCANAEGYDVEIFEKYDEEENLIDEWEESTCKYCRKEDFDDSTLLNFSLKRLGETREELIKEYKREHE